MGAFKNPMISEMVPLSYVTLEVGLCILLRWCSIGGRGSHIQRPVMLLRHPVKIVFPSYCIFAEYLSSMTLQPEFHRKERPRKLFISPVSAADFT